MFSYTNLYKPQYFCIQYCKIQLQLLNNFKRTFLHMHYQLRLYIVCYIGLAIQLPHIHWDNLWETQDTPPYVVLQQTDTFLRVGNIDNKLYDVGILPQCGQLWTIFVKPYSNHYRTFYFLQRTGITSFVFFHVFTKYGINSTINCLDRVAVVWSTVQHVGLL